MERSTDPAASFAVPLACLAHPASVAAAVCLLFNDHVLKGRAPALLTGKLSDFAGLFFFPYLMALGLAVSRAAPAQLRRWAFGLTAIWFAAAKTTEITRTARVAASLVPDSGLQPDLRLVDLAHDAASGRVVVAFRTEGALVREAGGTWGQESVGPVSPLASTVTSTVVATKIASLKWSALAALWLSVGALAPAAWLGAGRRQWRASARLNYSLAYLASGGAILVPALFSRSASSIPLLVREGLAIVFFLACALVAVSPIVTLLHVRFRRDASVSWSPRPRLGLALAASILSLAPAAVLPFTGLGVRTVAFPQVFIACAAFGAQVFLGWRDASRTG